MAPPFKIVHTLSERHYTELARLLSTTWWRRRTAKQQIIAAARHSGAVVALVDPASDQLLAFARAISDRTVKALVLDVIVEEPHRGTGLGKAVMAAIMDHPAVREVKDVELYCLPDMAPFYADWGFGEVKDGVILLRRTRACLAQYANRMGIIDKNPRSEFIGHFDQIGKFDDIPLHGEYTIDNNQHAAAQTVGPNVGQHPFKVFYVIVSKFVNFAVGQTGTIDD